MNSPADVDYLFITFILFLPGPLWKWKTTNSTAHWTTFTSSGKVVRHLQPFPSWLQTYASQMDDASLLTVYKAIFSVCIFFILNRPSNYDSFRDLGKFNFHSDALEEGLSSTNFLLTNDNNKRSLYLNWALGPVEICLCICLHWEVFLFFFSCEYF